MKNIIRNASFIALFSPLVISCDSDKKMDATQYPAQIKSYVQSNFPNAKIVSIEKDEGLDNDYEVELSDGTELQFNKDMYVTDIDTENGIPIAAIPTEIRQYVETNFPGEHITDWEVDDREQSIELSSGDELDFDMEGNILNRDH